MKKRSEKIEQQLYTSVAYMLGAAFILACIAVLISELV